MNSIQSQEVDSYLKPRRLGDVFALIQILATDQEIFLDETYLEKQLKIFPKSANSWIDVANEHPEFFLINDYGNDQKVIALLSRYGLGQGSRHGGGTLLSPNDTSRLMGVAMNLHDLAIKRENQRVEAQLRFEDEKRDREARRRETHQLFVTIGIAILSSTATVIAAVLSSVLK